MDYAEGMTTIKRERLSPQPEEQNSRWKDNGGDENDYLHRKMVTAEERTITVAKTELIEKRDNNKDDEKSKLSTLCGCMNDCYSKIPYDEINQHVITMKEMSKEQKDMYIMGKLASRGNIVHSETDYRKRNRYSYSFEDQEVCKSMFMFSHDIGEKSLKNLMKHTKSNGLVPRRHGNRGRPSPKAASVDTVNHVVQFIQEYAEKHGWQPEEEDEKDHTTGTENPTLILPPSTAKKNVHPLYVKSCKLAEIRSVKLSLFTEIWRSCLPHVHISMSKSSSMRKKRKTLDRFENVVVKTEMIEDGAIVDSLQEESLIEHT